MKYPFRSTAFVSVATLFALCPLSETSAAQVETITLESLLTQITNRDRLARWPGGAGMSAHLASSHDPRNPNLTPLGRPAGFGNVDFSNFIRWESNEGRKEWVMMEDQGPGMLTRMWVTGVAVQNTLRVYVDGNPTPVFEGTPSPTVAPNPDFGSALSFTTRKGSSSGYNLYAPIPYAQSIKITYDAVNPHGPGGADGSAPTPTHKTKALWYNIEYTRFAEDAQVTSYTRREPMRARESIEMTNRTLMNPAVTGAVTDAHSAVRRTLSQGQSLAHDLTGPGAIRRLQVRVSGVDPVAALRQTYLELTFDGERTARVPTGPFFGNGDSESRVNPYNEFQDYFRCVAEGGVMSCYWVMPYQRSARVRIVNESAQAVQVDLAVDAGPWQWDEPSMYFHADFRAEDKILTRPQPWPGDITQSNGYSGNGDAHWNYVTLRGRGVYVGDTLSIYNRTGGWWGEGDEKIYIDYLDARGAGHHAFPDFRGTGTEDYYGYAFCHAELFETPFINQPIAKGNPGGTGRTVNSRIRLLDVIPFQQALKLDLEIWAWKQGELDYAVTAYWYGAAGAKSMQVVADLAKDFQAGQPGRTARDVGQRDTAGDGSWDFLASDRANPSDSDAHTASLTWGPVGDTDHPGYGGRNARQAPALSDQYIFANGDENLGIQGAPGYHELALHPAGNDRNGAADKHFVVARWTAGASLAGPINIAGSVRNLISGGDGIDFHIFVNGREEFSIAAQSPTLPESPFDFDTTIAAGETVDFVLGNNGSGNSLADESLLRAVVVH